MKNTGVTEIRRIAVVVAALALLSASCSGGADTSTTVVAQADTLESAVDIVPLPSGLVIDEDPDSPVAATLTFDAGDHPINRIDFLGPKPSSNLPPTAAVVYLNGFEDALLVDFDASGAPSIMQLGDVGELRFEFDPSVIAFSYVAPDGSVAVERFPLATEDGAPEAMPGSRRTVTGLRVRHFDASVGIHRAVFANVSVSSPDAPLPPSLAAPYLRIAGCSTTRSNVSFSCNRLPGQIVESDEFLRTYRLAMTHTASAVVPGVDPSIWPSAQACEAALGNDWWINAPLGVSLETSAKSLGTVLLTWLANNPQAAAASATAAEGFMPGVAIAAAVVVGFYAGERAASDYLMGSEADCENIKRRVVALDVLGMTMEDVAFTIEVCLPPVDGWTFDHECQDIGPYRPFSRALATVPGDAASLDKNQLPSVEFIAKAEPGAVTGTVADAENGEPVVGAAISLSETGFETVTDSGGSFTLEDVPAGPHGLSVSAEGYAQASRPIHVETRLSTQVAITLDRIPALSWDEPRTYAGEGIHTLSFAGAVGSCQSPTTSVILTLFPDGRAEAIYTSESPEFTLNTVDDVHELVCLRYKPYAATLNGHHEAGHVVIMISTGDLVAFEGDYTADELVVEWRFTRDLPDNSVLLQSIVDYDFVLLHQGA